MNKQLTDAPAALAAFNGERGIPNVNQDGSSTQKRVLVVVVLLGVLALIGAMMYWKTQMQKERSAADANTAALQLTNAVPPRTFTAPPERVVAPPPLPEQPVPVVPTAIADMQAPYMPSLPDSYDVLIPKLDKSASSLMVAGHASTNTNDQNGRFSLSQTNAPNGLGSMDELFDSAPAMRQASMSGLLSPTQTATRRASQLGNRNFLLAKGAFIDCALQTRLDSTVPGMTACVVTRNIYSDNGKVLLIERGSTMTGEYQSNMRQGMARIFVLWSRIKTPSGIVVDLDSPGADPLGGAGLPGYVDTHFWQRFGGALMLSLVDDVARGLTTQVNRNGNNQFNLNSTGDATQDMAAEALKNTINIPPTLYKNQGEQIGIYVARDLDFSSIYDVTTQ